MSIYDQIANLGSNFNPIGSFMQGQNISQQNALYRQQQDEYARQRAEAEAEQERKNNLMSLAQNYVGAQGDERKNYLNKLAAIDPKYAKSLQEVVGGGGAVPFEGTGMDAQVYNTLIGYQQKKQSGMPTTPQEDMAYGLAYQRATKPSYVVTPEGTQYEVPGMDLSRFAPPGGGSPMQPGQTMPGQQTQPPAYGVSRGREVGSRDIPKFRNAAGNLSSFTDSANSLLNEIKSGGAELIPGTERYGRLQGMHTDLVMQAKNLYELGALQAPDIVLIEKLLPDPTSIRSGIKDLVYGPEEMIGKLNALKPVIERGKRSLEQKYGFSLERDFGEFPTFGNGGGGADKGVQINGLTVTVEGKTYTFPSKAQLNAWKKEWDKATGAK